MLQSCHNVEIKEIKVVLALLVKSETLLFPETGRNVATSQSGRGNHRHQ